MALKIKDNVKLKDLEKFGFAEDIDDWLTYNDVGDDYNNEPVFEVSICISNHEDYGLSHVDKNNIYVGVQYIPDIIFDFIKCGIVEKGDEK